jgi:hypothetical protein
MLTSGFDADPPDEVWTAMELEVGTAAQRRIRSATSSSRGLEGGSH